MDERWYLILGLFLVIIIYVDGAACGNAELEEGEVCDRNRLDGENCTNFNYTGGFLSCLDDCSGYNFNTCEGEEVCGNTIIGGGELCEPGNVRGRTCEDEGYEGGTLGCNDCVKYDYKQCTGNKSICGDGNVTSLEECDGSNINDKICLDLGFTGGILGCNSNCSFNIQLCVNETLESNVTEEVNMSGEVNATNESISQINRNLPSGVKGGIFSSGFDIGLSLGNWLIIFVGILVIGVVLIYFYVFRFKK